MNRPTCNPSTKAWWTCIDIGMDMLSELRVILPKLTLGTESWPFNCRAWDRLENFVHGNIDVCICLSVSSPFGNSPSRSLPSWSALI